MVLTFKNLIPMFINIKRFAIHRPGRIIPGKSTFLILY